MDYKEYVGGQFEQIGKWQYDFITSHLNVQPQNTFLDIACGSLRLGKHIIPFLQPNKYYGLECEQFLVDQGIQHELSESILLEKKPQFSINFDFDFTFCKTYDVAWANSLLSHLTEKDIKKLSENLKRITTPKSVFYFTYFDKNLRGKQRHNNPPESHARKDFYFTFEEIENIFSSTGWKVKMLQDTNHPRNQSIVEARL